MLLVNSSSRPLTTHKITVCYCVRVSYCTTYFKNRGKIVDPGQGEKVTMAKEVKSAVSMEEVPVVAPLQEKTTTLTALISQSVQSGDDQLLETALSITDPSIIEATLQKLPAQQVPSLLHALVSRSAKKPTRLPHLLPWIQGCISVHAGALAASPQATRTVLQPLQALLERRLESHASLLGLAGRLDLLMMQTVRRVDEGEAVRMSALVHKPVALYQADDDDDDDENEDAVRMVSDDSENDEDSEDNGYEEDNSQVSGSDAEMSVDEE